MKKLIVLAAISLISNIAMANDPGKSDTGIDYNKFEVDYQTFKISSTNYTGYTAQGSFLISDDLFVLGSFSDLKHTGSTTIERSNLGLGYRLGIAANTDAFTVFAFNTMTQTSTSNGYLLTLGVRSKIVDPIDVLGSYSYSTADSNHFSTINLGLNYKFTDWIYATTGYSSTSGSSKISAYNFGLGLKF